MEERWGWDCGGIPYGGGSPCGSQVGSLGLAMGWTVGVGGSRFAGMERMSRTGWIEIISGVMFSGKSEELMRRVRRATLAKKVVQVFKSQLDDRYGIREVISHDQGRLAAEMVSTSAELMARVRPETEVVAVDEIQFLDDGVVRVVNALADRGVRVVAAGTDMDFRGEPFGPIAALLAVAERIDKLNAICVRCGELATRNQRLIDGKPAPAEGPTIQVGGLESYEARCRSCHEVPEVGGQTSLLENDDPGVPVASG
jgi:thymidine kinase